MKFVKVTDTLEMATTQVTQKLWQKHMENNPSYFKGKNNPVETVSFNDCENFLKVINAKSKCFTYRLPTEDEWEFAAKSCYEQNTKEIAWCSENSDNTTHPVSTKLPNELGIYDMLGNVFEWTSSKKGSYRVIRGGSWGNGARYLRSAYRNNESADYRFDDVGFRLVRTTKLSSTLLSYDPRLSALEVAQKALRDIADILEKQIK